MTSLHPVMQALALVAATLMAGCGGTAELTGRSERPGSQPTASAQPTPPPVNIAGRWLLTLPGSGACGMTFSAGSAAAATGSIAPEGGCPGKFFTSRKWSHEAGSLIIRDHTGAPLAQLSATGAGFEGKAGAGEPVTLTR